MRSKHLPDEAYNFISKRIRAVNQNPFNTLNKLSFAAPVYRLNKGIS